MRNIIVYNDKGVMFEGEVPDTSITYYRKDCKAKVVETEKDRERLVALLSKPKITEIEKTEFLSEAKISLDKVPVSVKFDEYLSVSNYLSGQVKEIVEKKIIEEVVKKL